MKTNTEWNLLLPNEEKLADPANGFFIKLAANWQNKLSDFWYCIQQWQISSWQFLKKKRKRYLSCWLGARHRNWAWQDTFAGAMNRGASCWSWIFRRETWRPTNDYLITINPIIASKSSKIIQKHLHSEDNKQLKSSGPASRCTRCLNQTEIHTWYCWIVCNFQKDASSFHWIVIIYWTLPLYWNLYNYAFFFI